VDRRRNGIQESLVGIGGEVDHNRRLRRHGPRHLDVQHHFAIGSVRAVRLVLPVIDADRLDLGDWDAQAGEVGLDVGQLEPTPKLNDADAFPGPVARREVVDLGHLVRVVGRLGGMGNGVEVGPAGSAAGLCSRKSLNFALRLPT
jgi:hypothetical protein